MALERVAFVPQHLDLYRNARDGQHLVELFRRGVRSWQLSEAPFVRKHGLELDG